MDERRVTSLEVLLHLGAVFSANMFAPEGDIQSPLGECGRELRPGSKCRDVGSGC